MNRHASVNRIFRLVWNESLEAYVPAAEIARGRGRRSRKKLIATVLSLSAGISQAGPTGGQVTGGSGSIAQSGPMTTIRQSSQNLSLNWQTFNIASQETVNFVQPSATAIAVNRILDSNGSVILGHLNANGQVYLINPNGVLFGTGAQVNVGGLVASTLDVNDAALADFARTFSGTGTGSVVNDGNLTAAAGGAIALLGNHVSNSGVISAQLGTVALGAGSAATVTFHGSHLVSMQIDKSVLNSVASNGGLIRADGGGVLMTAGAQKALLASVVNNTGLIEARTIENHEGTITLLGGMSAGTVNVGGTLDASAPAAGNGGVIETSAAQVYVASTARISTAAAQGLTGSWQVDPTDFTIGAGTSAQSSSGIGATTLQSALGNTDVSITTSNTGTQNGDINVDAPVAWTAHKLTLAAANNINVNAVMAVGGSARVDFEPGASGNLLMGIAADGSFAGRVDISNSAANALTISGQLYTVIISLGNAADATTPPGTATLQATAGFGNLAGNFALGQNIDATSTSGWNAGSGFTPIGAANNTFHGQFDGLGHLITGLTINLPSGIDVGLFGVLQSASIRNLGLTGGNVTGAENVGFLAGSNNGAILNSFATGPVVGTGNAGLPEAIGGLAGVNLGAIVNSHATGSVTGTGEGSVGGLVGYNSDSVSTASIVDSYATGSVSATLNYVGGLAGTSTGLISHSHATGSVTGSSYVGGLVGYSQNTIDSGYATGNVAASGNFVGGLVGYLNSAGQVPAPVSNSYATGLVSGTSDVGGLIGYNVGSTISNSYATGNVAGTSELGGLVGYNDGLLSNAFYDVDAVSVNGAHWLTAGGIYHAQYIDWFSHGETLVIGNYSATLPIGSGGYYNVGSVQGLADLLGFAESNLADNFRLSANLSLPAGFSLPYFAGSFDGNGHSFSHLSLNYPNSNLGMFGYLPAASTSISNAGVTDAIVTGNTQVGGLIGFNKGGGSISGSYAAGTVTGSGDVGGLVGYSKGAISNSYFSGAVVSGNGIGIGGLVGYNDGGSISNTYASASVTGSSYVGGLVGQNSGAVSNSYASGRVTGSSYVGGLVGANYGTVGNSFYNATANGGLTGSGGGPGGLADVPGTVVGLNTGQLQAQANFTAATAANGNVNPGWDLNGNTGGAGIWFIYEGQTMPLLRAFMTPLTVSGDIMKTYDATAFSPGLGALTYSSAPDLTHLLGTLTVTGNAQGAVHAGSYSYGPGGLYSDQQGYLISYANGTLTIHPAPLTVSGTTVGSKIYDGTTVAALTGGSLAGLVGGDSVTLTQSGSFATKHAGTGIAVTANDSIGGTTAGDYTLTEPGGLTGTITPAPLTVSGTTVANKVYDGTTVAALTGGSLAGLLGGDSVTLTQSGSFATKHAGTGIAVTAIDSIGGAATGDYTLMQPGGLTGTITPAPLTVSGTTVANKVYDGTTVAALTGGSLAGLLGGDSVTLTQSGSFASQHAGIGIAVTANDRIGGAAAGDYTLTEPGGLTGTITPAPLTVSGTTVGDKVYDGTTAASLTGGSIAGVVSGDSVTLIQSGAFASNSPGTGIAVTATDTLSGASAGDYSIVEPSGLMGSILPPPPPPPPPPPSPLKGTSDLALAALNARAQIVENLVYPQVGANPQAIAVDVSTRVGATGTLKIENGGLRLPRDAVVGNE